MSAIDTIESIANCELINYDFRYCFVNRSKVPFTPYGYEARTDVVTDFVPFEELIESPMLYRKRIVGVGISIQASTVCAIDIDDCFATAFDFTSIDERGREVLDLFEDAAYCEFSFSGHGMRIIFLHSLIENYADIYYIKNSKMNIEYYQPSSSNRFVTVTGRYIKNRPIAYSKYIDIALNQFLEKFMVRPQFTRIVNEDVTTFTDTASMLRATKRLCIENSRFQSIWYGQAPGSNSNESELDYQMIALIYENITSDEDQIKEIFETSPYFKSKDSDHIRKWEMNNNRYFKYMYSHLK